MKGKGKMEYYKHQLRPINNVNVTAGTTWCNCVFATTV